LFIQEEYSMFEPATLKVTLRRIVADEFPASLEVFDIEADAAIADALAGRAISEVDRDLHSGFGGVELTHISHIRRYQAHWRGSLSHIRTEVDDRWIH